MRRREIRSARRFSHTAVSDGPAEEPVEQAWDIAPGARVELMQVVDSLSEQAGQVEKETDFVVAVLGDQYEPRPSAGPGLPAAATQPERTQRQMLRRHGPALLGSAVSVRTHRRRHFRVCCSNKTRQTCVNSGGSAEHGPTAGATAARSVVSSPVTAYRDTYTVMAVPGPVPASVRGGLAGLPASPPPSAGGEEKQTVGHPPTQPRWRYAGEEPPVRSTECPARALAGASGRVPTCRRSTRPSGSPCLEAAADLPTRAAGDRRAGTSRLARTVHGRNVSSVHRRCTCRHFTCRYHHVHR